MESIEDRTLEKENGNAVTKSTEEAPLTARAALGGECVACHESNRQLQNIRHLLARTQKVNEDLAAESVCKAVLCRTLSLIQAKWRTQFETATQQLTRHQTLQTRGVEEQLRDALQEQQLQRARNDELERSLAAESRASRALMEQLRQQQNTQEDIASLRAQLRHSSQEAEWLRSEHSMAQQTVALAPNACLLSFIQISSLRRTNDELRGTNNNLNAIVGTLKQSISGFDARLEKIGRDNRQQLDEVCSW